jgi:4-hydroxy-3-methylbut-2-enyl diphosphate reductase
MFIIQSNDTVQNESGVLVEIIIAKMAGFCFGVKRALDIASDIGLKGKKGIFTLGPIIHNPQVIAKLKSEGIHPVEMHEIEEKISKKEISTLIIRTHGIPHDQYDKIQKHGIEIIDATCPFVKKAQNYAQLLRENDYQVIILGDINHPEVKGIMSYAGEDSIVTDGKAPLPKLKSRVGLVVQTTQPVETLKKVLSDIIENAKELKVYNTICSSTAQRLKETETLAHRVDLMIVVGGKNSANTTQLAHLCSSFTEKTYHIETALEIEDSCFKNCRRVGITAGASKPDWIIKEVEERIRDIGGLSHNGT